MKKIYCSAWFLTFIVLTLFSSKCLLAQPIIIDHKVVDKYLDIPQEFVDSVKKMWVTVAGESHSSGYRKGMIFLQELDTTFKVNIRESGTPDPETDTNLRFSRAMWGDVDHETGWRYGYGEEDWYTSQTAIDRTKASITYCNSGGYRLDAMGFGWCWDMTSANGPGGEVDPQYFVHWAGASVGGPEGNMRWGLDKEDSILTGNSVCMDTYINATLEYISLCIQNDYKTKVFFTTGPVDGSSSTGERGYQRYLKHSYLRQFIQNSNDLILFDYADILNWSNDGEKNLTSWTDNGGTLQTFPMIHPDNMLDLDGFYEEDGDHIGERGVLRLAKAMWYMLAVINGWEGSPDEYITNKSAEICDGESIMINGIERSETGNYYDTLIASDGLDSIIVTHLNVVEHHITRLMPEICGGENYEAGGAVQTESGTYYDTLSSVTGCDSIIVTYLTVSICDDKDAIQSFSEPVLKIYPNPVQDHITLELICNNVVKFSLISTTGQIMRSKIYPENKSIVIDQIDIQNCQNGIYLARFESKGNIFYYKIFIYRIV